MYCTYTTRLRRVCSTNLTLRSLQELLNTCIDNPSCITVSTLTLAETWRLTSLVNTVYFCISACSVWTCIIVRFSSDL
ncbi:hypothetical protein BJY01DRAFT_14454 [Aspergillus pseudoustus]|uniref:Uncharacterized protein n=1 Tax=Aspergillus pseudoustus TaxID=1810923 RepID=A0ABR4JM82_9EURO